MWRDPAYFGSGPTPLTSILDFDIAHPNKRVVTSGGDITEYTLNDYGNPLKILERTNGSETSMTWSIDEGLPDNVLTSSTNENHRTTKYQFNKIGKNVSETESDGSTTLYEWNMEYAEPLLIMHPDGMQTSFVYDSSGNLIKFLKADGTKTVRRYNKFGEQVSETQDDGPTLNYFYNEHRNLQEIKVDDGTVVATFTNNHRGNVVKSVFWDGTQNEYRYDTVGRTIYKKEGDTEDTKNYDALGEQL